MTTAPLAPPLPLSVQFREGSMSQHKSAENSGFMTQLLAGNISAEGYHRYLLMLQQVYGALEWAAWRLQGDAVASVVIDHDLYRSGPLADDISFWGKLAGADENAKLSSPSVAAYVDAVRNCLNQPELYVAHHYARYLGDLSGGQAIGRLLTRHFKLEDGQGVSFYRFANIPKPKHYKDDYRLRLDALVVDEDVAFDMVQEVQRAFGLNEAMFVELAELYVNK